MFSLYSCPSTVFTVSHSLYRSSLRESTKMSYQEESSLPTSRPFISHRQQLTEHRMSLRSIQEEQLSQRNLNEDGVSISGDSSHNYTPKSTPPELGRQKSKSKNRIIDRGRNEYATYFKHLKRPSTSQGDHVSIRSWFTPSSRPEAPKFDAYGVEKNTYAVEVNDMPEIVNDAESQRSVRYSRKGLIIVSHSVLGLLFTG